MTSTRTGRCAVLLASLLVAGAVLAGCSAPEPVVPPSTVAPSASATPTPAAPALIPEGTAEDNLPFFTEVVTGVWNGPEQVAGRAYVDALVAAGFDRAAMQLTPDLTTVGDPAESIEFSVRWGEECLIGQVGPAIGTPVTVVLPGLPNGQCLIGVTRPIDW